MADDNRNNDDERQKRNGDFKMPSRNWIVWILIFCCLGLVVLFNKQMYTEGELITQHKFWDLLDAGAIVKGTVKFNPQSQMKEVVGDYIIVAEKAGDKPEAKAPAATHHFHTQVFLTDTDLKELLDKENFSPQEPNPLLMGLLWNVLFLLAIGFLIWFFFIRQIKMAGKGALSFGKSKARMLAKEKNKTTFKDVAGVDEAKEEVSELVEFLKDPKKFQKLGGRIPKGVLMVGAPGTGKTLLAKAIAGEADAAFFSISGSDFVEMFVGVGASRVRDMFEQARKNTPCLIFIDEIDAVGRSRGHGLGGGNDEREQTLNALLVEMDGFDTQEGIIIIAATNRPDVLDPALLRPGRFDRQITVNLPDVRGREAILKVHAKNVKLDPAVDLAIIARGTPGYSGAELANLLNEAALLAARTGKKAVGMPELEEARDKVRWGRERRSMAMTDEDKKFTAWHEAGHALVNVVLKHTHPLHKVTIIPRGQALGSTMFLPKDDILNRRRKEMLDIIAVTMAGRIAEEIVSDDISSGAMGDIQQATQMARAMVTQWGMSDKLGMIQYGESNEYVFLGREMTRGKDYSEQTAQEIDNEVKRIIDNAFKVASDIITTNRDKLELIANALLEYETLEGSQVEEIVRTGTFSPPPPPPQVEPPTVVRRAVSPGSIPTVVTTIGPGVAATLATLVVILAVACGSPGAAAPPPGSADSLVAYLHGVAGADEPTRQREVASWQLDAAAWSATVVPSYRTLYADYQRAFAAQAPDLVRRLAQPGALAARRHYAGDPRLTLAQARDRWALPTLYPSLVADLAGAPIDAVFVPDGPHWRALLGLDGVVRAHVAALDPACAAHLAHAGPTGRCTDLGAAIVTAALRTDRAQLAHVCRLAEALCGKGLP